MAILNMTIDLTGEINIAPRIIRINSTDSYVTITTAGYLSGLQYQGFVFQPTDIVAINYGTNGTTTQFFVPSFGVNNAITLSPIDASEAYSKVINVPNSSATPGTLRAFIGEITSTASVMTSGNLVGVRGVVNYVGASGGFLYGTQGKLIPTGTLSGSSWNAAVFGQFDVSAATINAGQLAAIWGDWGTTGATATSMTGARGFAFTNTTSNILNAQIYLYGPATQLLELDDNSGAYGATYYVAAGTGSGSAGNSTHCAAQQVIKITVNGSAAYIPVFTQNS